MLNHVRLKITVGILLVLYYCNGSVVYDKDCKIVNKQQPRCKKCGSNKDRSIYIQMNDLKRFLERHPACLFRLCTDENTRKTNHSFRKFISELYKEKSDVKYTIRYILQSMKPYHEWRNIERNNSQLEVVIYLYCDQLESHHFAKPTIHSFVSQSLVKVKGCCLCRTTDKSSNGSLSSTPSKGKSQVIIFVVLGGILFICFVCILCHCYLERRRPNLEGRDHGNHATDRAALIVGNVNPAEQPIENVHPVEQPVGNVVPAEQPIGNVVPVEQPIENDNNSATERDLLGDDNDEGESSNSKTSSTDSSSSGTSGYYTPL